MAYKRGKGPDANYDFKKQKDPKTPMGAGSFANMPDRPIFMTFAKDADYRDGIINSFTTTIEDTSDICENQR